MRVNELTQRTLASTGVEVCRGHYNGKDSEWIRYVLIEMKPAIYHDGTESGRIYHYIAWINSREAPDELACRVCSVIEEAGFFGISMEDAGYEEISGFNRIAIEFSYLDMAI